MASRLPHHVHRRFHPDGAVHGHVLHSQRWMGLYFRPVARRQHQSLRHLLRRHRLHRHRTLHTQSRCQQSPVRRPFQYAQHRWSSHGAQIQLRRHHRPTRLLWSALPEATHLDSRLSLAQLRSRLPEHNPTCDEAPALHLRGLPRSRRLDLWFPTVLLQSAELPVRLH